MGFRKIDHIEIIPKYYEETISFYTEILGFQVKSRQKVDAGPLKEVCYLDLNGTMVELMVVEGAKPASEEAWQIGYRLLALEVDDVDETLRYLAEKGVQPSWGPVSMGPSKRAEIKDPNGFSIELRQW